MIAFFKLIFGLIIAITVSVFAMYNRGDITITWSPLHPELTMPIYALALGCMALDFFAGVISFWLNTTGQRKKSRKTKKELKLLQKEI
jgi:uncharacterized integral membrane protein